MVKSRKGWGKHHVGPEMPPCSSYGHLSIALPAANYIAMSNDTCRINTFNHPMDIQDPNSQAHDLIGGQSFYVDACDRVRYFMDFRNPNGFFTLLSINHWVLVLHHFWFWSFGRRRKLNNTERGTFVPKVRTSTRCSRWREKTAFQRCDSLTSRAQGVPRNYSYDDILKDFCLAFVIIHSVWVILFIFVDCILQARMHKYIMAVLIMGTARKTKFSKLVWFLYSQWGGLSIPLLF